MCSYVYEFYQINTARPVYNGHLSITDTFNSFNMEVLLYLK